MYRVEHNIETGWNLVVRAMSWKAAVDMIVALAKEYPGEAFRIIEGY